MTDEVQIRNNVVFLDTLIGHLKAMRDGSYRCNKGYGLNLRPDVHSREIIKEVDVLMKSIHDELRERNRGEYY